MEWSLFVIMIVLQMYSKCAVGDIIFLLIVDLPAIQAAVFEETIRLCCI